MLVDMTTWTILRCHYTHMNSWWSLCHLHHFLAPAVISLYSLWDWISGKINCFNFEGLNQEDLKGTCLFCHDKTFPIPLTIHAWHTSRWPHREVSRARAIKHTDHITYWPGLILVHIHLWGIPFCMNSFSTSYFHANIFLARCYISKVSFVCNHLHM